MVRVTPATSSLVSPEPSRVVCGWWPRGSGATSHTPHRRRHRRQPPPRRDIIDQAIKCTSPHPPLTIHSHPLFVTL
jgi:hypothetical protein